jgi:hypothetical protein
MKIDFKTGLLLLNHDILEEKYKFRKNQAALHFDTNFLLTGISLVYRKYCVKYCILILKKIKFALF